MNFRSGFVGIWGRPNVGKSTFLNRVLGQKITIVSPKPQTTRKRIKGILHREDAQIVFIDTPGLHVPQDALGRFMFQETKDSLLDSDLLLYFVDPFAKVDKGKPYLALLSSFLNPIFLVVNKKDLVSSEGTIQEVFQLWEGVFAFREKMAISSVTGEGIEELLERIISYLPEGFPYYESGIISDTFERDIVAEIIREKAWWYLFEEIPYGVEVQVEEFREKEKVLYIRATLYVERESHKKIVIGSGGAVLKKIGQSAREELENQWGRKVFLDLWVKVEKNWRKKEEFLRLRGYCSR
ncbi:MAG: GTPase Era [Candidatus Caldatribacteriaceae bacterium]